MARSRQGWGFPRWGEYGVDTDAVSVRMCDYQNCSEKGEHPAPKSPGSRERWYFCEAHAAEYNRNWDFFAGMNKEQMARFMADDKASAADAFAQASPYGWGGAADGDGLTRNQRKAFEELELDPTATPAEIKSAYRLLAKRYHPDTNGGDKEANARFHRIRAAYDLLKADFSAS